MWTQYSISTVNWIVDKFEEPKKQLEGDQNQSKRSNNDSCPELEKAVVATQTLLIWDDPRKTLTAIASLNVGFWFLIWTRTPLSILCLLCFTVRLLFLWRTKIWPEIRVPPSEDQLEREDWLPLHPQTFTIPELERCSNVVMHRLTLCFNWLTNLRERNHAGFCLLMTSFFVITTLVGNSVSGVVIVYSLLMVCLLTPGILIHVVPSDWLRLDSIESDHSPTTSSKKSLLDILNSSSASATNDSDNNLQDSSEKDNSHGSVFSKAEAVINIISSHFSTPRDSSPSESLSDEDFEMVQESDISK